MNGITKTCNMWVLSESPLSLVFVVFCFVLSPSVFGVVGFGSTRNDKFEYSLNSSEYNRIVEYQRIPRDRDKSKQQKPSLLLCSKRNAEKVLNGSNEIDMFESLWISLSFFYPHQNHKITNHVIESVLLLVLEAWENKSPVWQMIIIQCFQAV